MSGRAHVLALAQPMVRAEAFALAKRLEMDEDVSSVEIDEWLYPQLTPNDPAYSVQWHLRTPDGANGNGGAASLPAAWDVSQGQGVIVGVIDSGVVEHPDLDANVVRPGGYDFIGDVTNANDGDGRDTDPSDPGNWRSATDCPGAPTQKNSTWHGTIVSGIVAAVTNNATGVAGVAHQARVLPLRVLGRCGALTSDVADAIRWAAGVSVPGIANNANRAKVINISLGSSSACSVVTQDAINDARAAGVVIVVATGNESFAVIGQPANCTGVVAVTAHTLQGDNSDFANVGPGTSVSAPGGGACKSADNTDFSCSTRNSSGNNNFRVWSTGLYGITTPTSMNAAGTATGPAYVGSTGTSLAAPHVAGVAALLLGRMPNLTPDEVTFLITSSARPHPAALFCSQQSPGTCGSGLLDATAAISRLSDRTPLVTVSSTASVITGGQQATLTATATPRNSGSGLFAYTWTQTSGPSVVLTNASTATATFSGTNPGGTHGFNVSVRDGNGYIVMQTISVRSNNAPMLNAIAPASVTQGNRVALVVAGVDPEGDALTYVASNLPAGSTLSASTGQFEWNTGSIQPGTYTFNVFASDGALSSAQATATITVTERSSGGGGSMTLFDCVVLLVLSQFAAFSLRPQRPTCVGN